MNSTISKAIENLRVLHFVYKGDIREVEPHTFGSQISGEDALCAWQSLGGSGQGFRLFLVKDIAQCSETGAAFSEPRPGYRAGDTRFSQIYAQL